MHYMNKTREGQKWRYAGIIIAEYTDSFHNTTFKVKWDIGAVGLGWRPTDLELIPEGNDILKDLVNT